MSGSGPYGRAEWLRWPMLLAFWTLPAVLLATQIAVMASEEGHAFSWWTLFVWQVAGWWFWVPATPMIFWLSRRIPFARRRWWKAALVHLGLGALAALLHVIYLSWLTGWIGPAPYRDLRFGFMVGMWLTQRLHLDLMAYGGLLGVGYGLDSYRMYKDRELHASQLEAQLALAQLQALKMQLHPHFLFNTLHAISVLVRKGANDKAVSMLAGLSDLLRMALDNVGAQEVSLQRELEFLECYLELEQTRFQDRLEVRLEIEPATLDSKVPNMILQPLVENAIRHGIARRAEGGVIEVSARRDASILRLEIRDDGGGVGEEGFCEGVGLSNTRKRLRRLYGADHQFVLSDGKRGGAVALVEIPFRPAHT